MHTKTPFTPVEIEFNAKASSAMKIFADFVSLRLCVKHIVEGNDFPNK